LDIKLRRGLATAGRTLPWHPASRSLTLDIKLRRQGQTVGARIGAAPRLRVQFSFASILVMGSARFFRIGLQANLRSLDVKISALESLLLRGRTPGPPLAGWVLIDARMDTIRGAHDHVQSPVCRLPDCLSHCLSLHGPNAAGDGVYVSGPAEECRQPGQW